MTNLLDKALDGRYKNFPLKSGSNYIFDKLIFSIFIIVILAFSIFVLSSNGFDKSMHPYAKCDSANGCFNPYYENTEVCGKAIPVDHPLCTTQPLPNNYVYGEPEPFYVSSFSIIVIGLLVSTLLTNHLIYNRGKLREELQHDE